MEEFIKIGKAGPGVPTRILLPKDKVLNKKNVFIKRTIHEEEVELSIEELDRMERNCNVLISNAQRTISEQKEKLVQISKLRGQIIGNNLQPEPLMGDKKS